MLITALRTVCGIECCRRNGGNGRGGSSAEGVDGRWGRSLLTARGLEEHNTVNDPKRCRRLQSRASAKLPPPPPRWPPPPRYHCRHCRHRRRAATATAPAMLLPPLPSSRRRRLRPRSAAAPLPRRRRCRAAAASTVALPPPPPPPCHHAAHLCRAFAAGGLLPLPTPCCRQ